MNHFQIALHYGFNLLIILPFFFINSHDHHIYTCVSVGVSLEKTIVICATHLHTDTQIQMHKYTVEKQNSRIQNDSCEYAFACGRLQFELCCWLLISIVGVVVSIVAAAATTAKMLENPKTYFT